MGDETNTELLVHIAAPARVADDESYRLLARAYLDFQPGPRISFAAEQRSFGKGHDGELRGTQANLTLLSAISSPEVSFESAFGNSGSPPLHEAREPRENGARNSQSLWIAPPSVVQDSLPDNNLAFSQYCSPTRILEHYLSAFGSSQASENLFITSPFHHLPSIANVSGKQASPTVGGFQQKSLPQTSGELRDEDTADVSTKELAGPTTSSLPPLWSSSSEQRGEDGEPAADIRTEEPGGIQVQILGEVIPTSPAVGDHVSLASAFGNKHVESRAPIREYDTNGKHTPSRSESEPAVKKARISPTPFSGHPLVRSSSDIGPRHEHNKTQRASCQRLDHLEIVSPAPTVSSGTLTPEDMITESLINLAHKVDLKKRFIPELQSRELRPFERGYWLVDCSSWDQALKDAAWRFLTDHLENGLAGWGTTCKRDQAFTWMRLYCWGCIIGHMYLVIWLASERRVKHTGASWVSADGRPVIVMGARPPSR